jgi:hypothetical protein
LGDGDAGLADELAIDAFGSELVHDDPDAEARGRGFLEPAKEEGGLAGTEEPGEDNDREG